MTESSETENFSLETIRELVAVAEARLNDSETTKKIIAFGEDSGKEMRSVTLEYLNIRLSLSRVENPGNPPQYDSETGTFLIADVTEGTVKKDPSRILSFLINDTSGIDGIQIPSRPEGVNEETVDFLFKYSRQSLFSLVYYLRQATVVPPTDPS